MALPLGEVVTGGEGLSGPAQRREDPHPPPLPEGKGTQLMPSGARLQGFTWHLCLGTSSSSVGSRTILPTDVCCATRRWAAAGCPCHARFVPRTKKLSAPQRVVKTLESGGGASECTQGEVAAGYADRTAPWRAWLAPLCLAGTCVRPARAVRGSACAGSADCCAIFLPSLPPPPVLRPAPQGTPAGPTLSHPALPV